MGGGSLWQIRLQTFYQINCSQIDLAKDLPMVSKFVRYGQGLILTALGSRKSLIFKEQNFEIYLFSSSGSVLWFGFRTTNFKARGLILWHRAFHLCPKGMV